MATVSSCGAATFSACPGLLVPHGWPLWGQLAEWESYLVETLITTPSQEPSGSGLRLRQLPQFAASVGAAFQPLSGGLEIHDAFAGRVSLGVNWSNSLRS